MPSSEFVNSETPYMNTVEKFPQLFPAVPENRKDFPLTAVDRKAVLDEEYRGRLLAPGPLSLRVNRYFKKVPDFDRDERNRPIWTSLRGPEKLAAREQFVREKFIAMAEATMLREALEGCYQREGADARVHCKHLVKAYSQTIATPYYGMEKVRAQRASDVLAGLNVVCLQLAAARAGLATRLRRRRLAVPAVCHLAGAPSFPSLPLTRAGTHAHCCSPATNLPQHPKDCMY